MPEGTAFDFQPRLEGETLTLAPLRREDFEGLARAAGDPAIWAGHPAPDRYRREVFAPFFEILVGSGSALAIRDRLSGEIIGVSRYYVAEDAPDAVAIGFTFLTTAYWGGATNRELKRLMLNHAFARFEEVWFHIGPTNLRSQRATEKLGARFVRRAVLDLAGGPVEWMCYRLRREDWPG